MKIATIVVRVLMGLLFLFASITYFLKLFPPPEMEGNFKLFFEGMQASGYLLPLVKVTELICGIAFVTGRFVPLATVLIAPIIINILMVHILLAPAGLPTAIFLVAANLFLALNYRKSYRGLFVYKV